jgi:hypothetical protein
MVPSRGFSYSLTPFILTICTLHCGCKKESGASDLGSSDASGLKTSSNSERKSLIKKSVADKNHNKLDIHRVAAKKDLTTEDFAIIEKELLALAETDPRQVLDFLSKDFPDLCAYDFAGKCLKDALANISHDDISLWLAEQSNDSYVIGFALDILTKSGENDLIENLLNSYKSSGNLGLLHSLFASLARKDPQLALLSLDQSSLSRAQKNEINSQVAMGLSLSDPEAALAILHRSGQKVDPGAYAIIIASWVNADPVGALEHISKLNSADVAMLLNNPSSKGFLLRKDNLSAVMHLLEERPLTNELIPAHKQVINELAKHDADQALQALLRVNSSSYKNNLIKDVIATIAKTNLNDALSFVSKLSPDEKYQGMRGIASSLAVEDFDAAIKLAENEVDVTSRDMFREIARTSVGNDPLNAVKMIENVNFSAKMGAEFRSEMINHTVQSWAKQNREEAQQWVEKLPATDQQKGVQGLVATWMKTDPVAASEWLSQQPAGPARDAGAQEIINQIKDTDPEMAEQWRKSMTPK